MTLAQERQSAMLAVSQLETCPSAGKLPSICCVLNSRMVSHSGILVNF